MPHASEFPRAASSAGARLVVDTEARICAASDAAHELLGYHKGTLLGLSVAWLLPPARQSVLAELSAAFRNGGRLSLPGTLMREDGSLIPVLMVTRPCTSERGPALALQLERDETLPPA